MSTKKIKFKKQTPDIQFKEEADFTTAKFDKEKNCSTEIGEVDGDFEIADDGKFSELWKAKVTQKPKTGDTNIEKDDSKLDGEYIKGYFWNQVKVTKIGGKELKTAITFNVKNGDLWGYNVMFWVGIIVLILAVVGGGWYYWTRTSKEEEEEAV